MNSASPYDDAANAVNFSPLGWVPAVATFALQHLLERLRAGQRPAPAQITDAVARVNAAVQMATQKSPASARPAIQALGQQVLTLLQQ